MGNRSSELSIRHRSKPRICCVAQSSLFFPSFINKSDPQDVQCTTPQSWQGDPLRVPVASPRPWLFLGIEPNQSHQNVSPFHHSRETSLSLHPSILSGRSGAIAPLNPLAGLGEMPLHLHRTMHEPPAVRSPIRGAFEAPTDTPMTISWRRFQRDQPCADWMPIRSFETQYPAHSMEAKLSRLDTTKSLPVLFGNMGQPCSGWICAAVSLL